MIHYFIIVVICSLFSAFFSCADMVYGIVDKNRLQKQADAGKKTAKLALKLANDYEFSISSILFGNNIVNVLASSVVTLIGLSQSQNGSPIGVLGATIIFTCCIILFCEFLPKILGKRFSFSLSKFFALPVTVFKYITFPFVYPIARLFKIIGKPLHKRAKEEDIIDEDILTEMVDTIEEDGGLEENEAEIVRGAIDLHDIQAFEIMTPRVDCYMIDISDDPEEVLKDPALYTHSRIPLYEDTPDKIIGILPLKGILQSRLKGEKIDFKSLMYTPLFIPRNHQVMDVLNEFRSSHVHIAIVLDEYGGTEGIITMEDILEEVVGEIFDETDKIEEEYIDQGNGTYLVNGGMNIDDFFELINYHEEFETDYSTVAGLCQEILDRFAVVGDKFNFSHYSCKVIEAEKYAVTSLLVRDLDWKKENVE